MNPIPTDYNRNLLILLDTISEEFVPKKARRWLEEFRRETDHPDGAPELQLEVHTAIYVSCIMPGDNVL